ncbi:hypothetical protein, partial [Actinocorallia aurantiaca]|uniref:hypothetical protein n=1 Tax=Actinocorallia aurantiaca TaxID=46204 RepID=UPI0031D54F38
AFSSFADFLLDYVAEVRKVGTPIGESKENESVTQILVETNPSRHWITVSPALAAGTIILALISIIIWNFTDGRGIDKTEGSPPNSTPNTEISPAPIKLGSAREEQAGQYGAPTFSDAKRPAVSGVPVKPYEKVKVSCKIFAPTIPSVSPDGYWYLIASPPWNNEWYAPANTFLNGDPINAEQRTVTHNTDTKVPDC